MAKQRFVKTSFRSDGYINDLSVAEKLLYLYLFTNDFIDLCGIYELGRRRVTFETGLQEKEIEVILEKFEADGKIQIFESWIFMINFVKNQANNPSVQKGVIRSFLSTPQHVLNAFGIDIKSEDRVIRRVHVCPSQRKRILERDKICTKCGTPGGISNKLGIDHIQPVWLGGKNTDNNLRVLCQKCNNERELDSLSQDGSDYLTLLNLTLLNLTLPIGSPKDFEKFWETYPRKEAKGNAEKSFKKALEETTIENILEGVENYNLHIKKQGTEKKFVKLPATWLNQKCWLDNHKSAKPSTPPTPPPVEPEHVPLSEEERERNRKRFESIKAGFNSKITAGTNPTLQQ